MGMAAWFRERMQELRQRWGARKQGPSSRQRRLHLRPACRTVVTCQHLEGSFTAVVEDMSVSGLRMSTPCALPVGTRVFISQPQEGHRGEVGVEIVWCRAQPRTSRVEMGARFQSYHATVARSWVQPALAIHSKEAYSLENRAYYRAAARLPAEVTATNLGHRVVVRAQAIDVSRSGLQLESTHAFPMGETVDITLPGGRRGQLRVRGRVVRCRVRPSGARVGIEFVDVRPAVTEELEWLVHRLLQRQCGDAA